jgi:5-methylcytosine-specific restriction endonuclease McrA
MGSPGSTKKRSRKVSGIPAKILAVLQAHPEGLDIHQIRAIVSPDDPQQHLDRRLRDLDPLYVIKRDQIGSRRVYTLVGERPEGEWDYDIIPKDLRAQALRNGRCAMCGRTVEEDGIKMHADHRIPREWGGQTVAENLVGLCSACNEGKRNFFAGFDPEEMKGCINFRSPHMRIALLLKSKINEWVDTDYLEFVANFRDYQEDWQKRLRELRDLGLEIENRKVLTPNRTLSQYRLTRWVELPPEDQIRAAIRAKEKVRRRSRDEGGGG